MYQEKQPQFYKKIKLQGALQFYLVCLLLKTNKLKQTALLSIIDIKSQIIMTRRKEKKKKERF